MHIIATVGSFLFNHLEYVVATGGGIVAFTLIKTRRIKHSSNDLTHMVIKLNKNKEALTKKSKSIV